jgi:hypothetical protein
LASTDISYASKVATVISNFRKAKTDFDGQDETLGDCSHYTNDHQAEFTSEGPPSTH